LDIFVPDVCRNDWQRFQCLELSRDNSGEYTLRVSHENHQYTFKVDAWDAEIRRCVVVCTNSPCPQTVARNDRANLTWVLLRLAEIHTPAAPTLASRMWGHYDNAAALRDNEWLIWGLEAGVELAVEPGFIPPMPAMAPQLLPA
jgi:hypothetical protein